MLPSALVEKVLARYPLPIADAVSALDAAESLWERRDRVVEVFRSWSRFVAAMAMAARAQFGRGPDGEIDAVAKLLSTLRRRGLTDGQWVSLCRELTRAYRSAPEQHALPGLVRLFHQGKRSPIGKELDGLLEMRKSETVAHGGTGDGSELERILGRRVPQLEKILESSADLFSAVRLVVPLAPTAVGDTEEQRAWLLAGYTPARGRWRRITLAGETSVPPGQPILVDESDTPVLALHPFAMVRRPTPEAIEECFVLDGGGKRGALYVAFPSMAEHRVRDAWQAIDAMLGHVEEATELAVQGIDRPYRGLASFSEKHAPIFFGREAQTEELANRIRRHAMVTVTGPSGSGKSSLLHAGVLPQLGDFRVIKLRPGSQPVATLARRLDEFIGQAWLGENEHQSTADVLATDPKAIGSVVDSWCRQSRAHVAVIVDQAEELFTLCTDETKREVFAEALASLGCDADGPLRVVISLREDYFGRLATLAALRGLYSRQVEVVTTPDRTALIGTLISPARLFDYQFEDEELVASMVDPLVGQPAALPLLQFCADQLWERRDRSWKRMTRDALAQLGGVEGALAAHAEAIFKDFTASQESAARLLMLHLITEDGTRAVVSREELVASIGSRSDAKIVLDRLIDARLLTVREGEGADGSAVEIVHEALISKWDRLTRWLEEDREYHVVRHRVAAAYGRWRDEGRAGDFLLGEGKPLAEAEELLAAHPELVRDAELDFINASQKRVAARRRVKRFAVLGLVGLVVAATGFGYVALKEREQARENARLAEESKRRVEKSAEDIILLQARGALATDPTAAIAWLKRVRVTEENAATIRSLAREARSEGVAMRELATGMPTPSRLYVDEERGELVVANRTSGLAAFDRETGKQTWKFGRKSPQSELSFSNDGRYVYIFSITPALLDAPEHQSPYVLVDLKTRTVRELGLGDAIAPYPLVGPDGKWLVEIWMRKVWLTDTETAKKIALAEGDYHPVALFNPEVNRVVAFKGSSIELIDIESQTVTQLSSVRIDNAQAGVSVPGKKLAVVGLVSGDLAFVDLETGTVEFRKPGFGAYASMIVDVVAAPDGSRVWAVQSDGRVETWDTETKKSLGFLRTPNEKIRRLVVSPDSKRLAAATQAGVVHLIEVEGGAGPALRAEDDHNGPLAFAADGTLYTSTNDGSIRAWPPSEMGSRQFARSGSDIRYSAKGELIASGSRLIRVWGANGEQIEEVDFPEEVRDVVLDPEGALGIGVGAKVIYIWQRGMQGLFEAPIADSRRATFSPDGDQVLLDRGVFGLFRVEVADLKEGKVAEEPYAYDIETYSSAAIDVNGNAVIVGDDRNLRGSDDRGAVRYFRDGDEDGKRYGEGQASVAAISPDGTYAIGGSLDGGLIIANTKTGDVKQSEPHERSVIDLSVTADSKWLVSVALDRQVFITELATGESRRLVGEMTSANTATAFGLDDSVFATSAGGYVNFWHLASGRLERFGGARMAIVDIAIHPQEKQLAAIGAGGRIKTWNLEAPSNPAALTEWIQSSTEIRFDTSRAPTKTAGR